MMNRRHTTQGCLFILVCVGAGWLLASTTSTGSDATSPDAHPSWLLGSWSQIGQCGKDDAFYFEFDASGHFDLRDVSTSPEISGDYTVDDGLIRLENLTGSEAAIRKIGGSSSVIEYERDASSGALKFKGNTVQRCAEGPPPQTNQ